MQKTYQNYKPVDFLKNERFIKWQLFPDEEDHLYWNSFIKKYPEQNAVINEAISLMKGTKLNAYSYSRAEKEEIWTNINKKITKHSTIKRWGYAASIAACFMIIVLGSLWTFNPATSSIKASVNIDSILQGNNITLILSNGKILPIDPSSYLQYKENGTFIIKDGGKLKRESTQTAGIHTLIVPRGKTSFLSLADGTKVWINSETILNYPAQLDSAIRKISIEGEAYVEVTKNKHKPFIVHTSRFDVHVLGTKFNVSSYKEEVTHSVVLAQGKVKVYSDKLHTATCLKPNEMFSTNKDSCYKTKVNAYNYICWKNGLLYLESQPLSTIINKLSRHYAVNIILEKDIHNLKCSGKIVLFEDLDVTLKNIANVIPITYTPKGDNILISKKINTN